jgi:hypothetical protein
MAADLAAIPGASYTEIEEENGHSRASVLIPYPLPGEYSVKVLPKPDAAPTDTYTLVVTRGDATEVLAEDQPVQEIPGEPLRVLVPIQAQMDIRPDSDSNTVNPRSEGVIPVAILTTETFDAQTVNSQSVRFGPSQVAIAHKTGHFEDVDNDGDVDLVLHFQTQETGIACGDTEASLSGETLDGTPIEGSDTIVTVGCN